MALVEFDIKIPNSLSDITLSEYQKYLKLLKDNEGAEGDFIDLKTLDIFCGLKMKDSFNLPLNKFRFMLDRLTMCFKEATPLQQRFTLVDNSGASTEFGFIPNLETMSYGEYVDLEKYISDWDNMHRALAIMYRPITLNSKGNYRIEDYEGSDKYCEAMREVPVNIALGSIVFFYRLGKKLSKYTMDYMIEEVQEKGTSIGRKHLEKNGEAISRFTHLLKEMSESSIQSPSFHYTSV